MALTIFIQILAVAQATLLFGTPAVGKGIPVKNRDLANTTSPTITSSPSRPLSTGSFDLNACLQGDASDYDEEWRDCYRSGDPEAIGFFPSQNPYNTTANPYNIVPPNPSLASMCGDMWTSSASVFFSTAVVTTQEINTSPTVYWTDYQDSFSWIPEEPCCLNCTLLGGSVTVMMWPTPAPTPAVSTLIDTGSNFTFVSPSVYVAFESVGATDMCGSIGSAMLNKTLAFDSTDLSTQRNYYAATDASDLNVDYCTHATPNGPWETYDYANAAKGICTEITTSWWSYYASNDTTKYTAESEYSAASDISCGFGCLGMPLNRFTCVYNPCSPWISVPTQVYNFNPKFQTCIDGIKAFFDPPYTLTKGYGLSAFTAIPVSASSAVPAQTPAPELASATPIPAPVAPTPKPTVTSENLSEASSIQDVASPGATKSTDPLVNYPSEVSNTQETITYDTPQPTDPAADPKVQTTSGLRLATSAGSLLLLLGSKTLLPGSSAVVSGKTYSLSPSGNAVVIDGASQYFIGTQTLVAGGAAVTISGTVVSLAAGGTSVVVGGSTEPVESFLATATSAGLGGAIMTIGGFGGGSSETMTALEITGRAKRRNAGPLMGVCAAWGGHLGLLWLL